MKKLSVCCIAGLLVFALYLAPLSVKAGTAPDTAEAVSADAAGTNALHLTYIELEETEKWILDEVLSDHVSEDVVALTEAGTDYSIGDWVDRGSFTYLFFDKYLADGTVYTAAGYAKTADGSYVYFELSSPDKLTRQQVDLEISRVFGSYDSILVQAC